MGKENPLQNLPAIVLCGGHGTRLKEETGDGHPKPLVPVEPSTALVEASIAQVETGGTSHIIFATSARIVDPLRKQLRLNWDNHPQGGMLFSVEDEPKGVVEAVKQAIEEGKLHDRNFLLVHADELVPRINLPAMLKQHYRTGAQITELVTNHPDAGNNYVIWLDSTRKVVKLKRHPDQWQMVGGYTATGFFIFSPDAFLRLAKTTESWKTLLSNAVANGQLYGFPCREIFCNANTPEELERLRLAISHFRNGCR